MAKKTKATLTELIHRRRQGEMDKFKVKHYYSETLGMEIEIVKIPIKQFLALVDGEDDSVGGMDGELDSLNRMIYEVCPMFKENTKEAMEEYGVSEPFELPSAVLEEQMNELKDIAEIASSFYGLDKIGDDIKKESEKTVS